MYKSLRGLQKPCMKTPFRMSLDCDLDFVCVFVYVCVSYALLIRPDQITHIATETHVSIHIKMLLDLWDNHAKLSLLMSIPSTLCVLWHFTLCIIFEKLPIVSNLQYVVFPCYNWQENPYKCIHIRYGSFSLTVSNLNNLILATPYASRI